MSELKIASIVATGNFDREFDLAATAADIDAYSCDYSEDEHSGIYLKFYQEGPTVTIFRSGAFNIRGASSKEELEKNKQLIEDKIFELDITGTISGFGITNIVFTSELEGHINLNEMSIKLGLENVEYEPEQFPGLIFRINQGVIIIFTSGKLVLTGFTNAEEAKVALNTLSTNLTDV